jgi:hypothetical protein
MFISAGCSFLEAGGYFNILNVLHGVPKNKYKI